MSDDGVETKGFVVPKYLLESVYGSVIQSMSFGFITKEEAARRRAEREAWQKAHPWRYRAQRARRVTGDHVDSMRRWLGERIGGSTLHQDCNDY